MGSCCDHKAFEEDNLPIMGSFRPGRLGSIVEVDNPREAKASHFD